MELKITTTINSIEEFSAWSGGKDNLDLVIDENLVSELDSYLESMFENDTVDETTLNDILWFDLDEFLSDYDLT